MEPLAEILEEYNPSLKEECIETFVDNSNFQIL